MNLIDVTQYHVVKGSMPSTTTLLRRAVMLARTDANLFADFQRMRRNAGALSQPISVDLTSRCNLFCEGCYYYEGDTPVLADETDLDKWVALFRRKAKEGTRFAYIAGAEPALYPARLQAAAEFIPYGTLATNGTLKIPRDVPYRISVSVWGNEELTARLRGGNTFWKAVRNYAGDPRAFFAYTLTSQNLDQVREVAKILGDHGTQLTFNMYSPTTLYRHKLADHAENDRRFFRVSSMEDNLCFDDDSLSKCRDIVAELIEDFPDTIVYPRAFNHEVTTPGPLYQLDPVTGYATDCAGFHNGTHETYLNNLQMSQAKCCMPNIDCGSCRALTSYLPSRLRPRPHDVEDVASLKRWLEICDYWAWFYLGPAHAPKAG